ncbi:MAG TPA: transporter [Chromatiales bacterium]|nr:transporter [Chromatiales bacterium]
MKPVQRLIATGSLVLCGCGAASAHNPVFSPGPHVLFKEGIEIHSGVDRNKAGQEKEARLALELTYGLSGDWSVGVELPYAEVARSAENGSENSRGIGDMQLFSKYRFWRESSLGVQESAAVFLNAMLDNGDASANPPLGSGTTDRLLGFTYGYESLTWYRWTSIRYRRNGENSSGLRRGDNWLVDFALGYRPTMPRYLKPDTVWILELNGERARRAEWNGSAFNNIEANTGGIEWFISPGIFWTLRNFAIKAGVQLPVSSALNGDQAESDYRTRLEFEWHL